MTTEISLADPYTGEKPTDLSPLIINEDGDKVELTIQDIEAKLNFFERETETLAKLIKYWLEVQKQARTFIQKA